MRLTGRFGRAKIVNRLIHMNGRVFSPSLGRMLSPDPVTQAPQNGQNYNRYSYAYNNPLKYTDPSGYCAEGVTAFLCDQAINYVIGKVFGGLFGSSGCDRQCQYRQQANKWCKGITACWEYRSLAPKGRYKVKQIYSAYISSQYGDSTSNGDPVQNSDPVTEELISKAIAGETVCGPGGKSCIVYGTEEVLVATGDGRINWEDLTEEDWSGAIGVPVGPGGAKVRTKSIFGLETQILTQEGRYQLEYEVGVRYTATFIVNGIEVGKSQIGSVKMTGKTDWQNVPGLDPVHRRRYRFCVPKPGFEQGCTPDV